MFAHVVVSRIADIVVQSVVVCSPHETGIRSLVCRFAPVPLDARFVAHNAEITGQGIVALPSELPFNDVIFRSDVVPAPYS